MAGKFILYPLLSALLFIYSCSRIRTEKDIFTKNIVIVVMDGARYSETWGDSLHTHIPHIAKDLAPEGIILTNFNNNGPTYTLSGHTSITTGIHQEIDNSGNQLPDKPSFFQIFRSTLNLDSTLTWIITSKDKLEVLSDCNDIKWKGTYRPMKDCGISGNGSGYRHDSVTFKRVISVLKEYHPELLLVNFREPDFSGHTGVFKDYLKGVEMTDEYSYNIWKFLKDDEYYRNTTAFFIVNDHGRHLDGISDGFAGHGDTCRGCRHILLYASGPDFKKGKIDPEQGDLIDITRTVYYLLKIRIAESSGKVLEGILK